jgi:hypothetical protein
VPITAVAKNLCAPEARHTLSAMWEGTKTTVADEVFDTKGAARHLGVSEAFLERKRCTGGGPAFVKLGARVTYRREDLDAWIAANRRYSTNGDATIEPKSDGRCRAT